MKAKNKKNKSKINTNEQMPNIENGKFLIINVYEI